MSGISRNTLCASVETQQKQTKKRMHLDDLGLLLYTNVCGKWTDENCFNILQKKEGKNR